MPSIPQSLLWISLVVLWLFVLVPMLVSKRDAVRRTSDVALATRVLNNGGAGARLLKRTGPAAGHLSDPDWTPEEEPADDEFADTERMDNEEVVLDAGFEADFDDQADDRERTRPVVMRMTADERTEPDYLDVDVIEDSAALPVGNGASMAGAEFVGADVDGGMAQRDNEFRDGYRHGYEDSSGLEPEEAPQADDEGSWSHVAPRSRQRRFDTKTAAAVTARKYAFRKRVLMVMAVVLVGSATAAFVVSPAAWWLCAPATGVTLLYLAYLRRQTRIEERVRRRRVQRMMRVQPGADYYGRDYDVPSRLRRPGAVVLEVDDEDPIFEHLDDVMAMRAYGWGPDLPRAVGQ